MVLFASLVHFYDARIAYVGNILGFETARTFKTFFVTDFRFVVNLNEDLPW